VFFLFNFMSTPATCHHFGEYLFSMIDCTARLLRITIQASQAEYDMEDSPPANHTSHDPSKAGPPQLSPVPRRAYIGRVRRLLSHARLSMIKSELLHPLHSSFTPLRHTTQTPPTRKLADLTHSPAISSLACTASCTRASYATMTSPLPRVFSDPGSHRKAVPC
jgi:hypothetical protein